MRGGIPKANCLAAYQPKSAASYAVSKVNLVLPGTYDLVDGVAFPTWDITNGWIFPSPSIQAILTSTVTLSNATTVLCRFVGGNPTIVNGRLFNNSADSFLVILDTGATHQYKNGTVGLNVGAGLTGSHIIGIAGASAILDGAVDGTITTADIGTTTTLVVGNRSSDTARQVYANIQALVVYSVTLTLPQIVAVTNAMNLL